MVAISLLSWTILLAKVSIEYFNKKKTFTIKNITGISKLGNQISITKDR